MSPTCVLTANEATEVINCFWPQFITHCKEKINKAYAMLGIIKRNFIYLSEEAFVSLYKTYLDLIWKLQIVSGIHIGWD